MNHTKMSSMLQEVIHGNVLDREYVADYFNHTPKEPLDFYIELFTYNESFSPSHNRPLSEDVIYFSTQFYQFLAKHFEGATERFLDCIISESANNRFYTWSLSIWNDQFEHHIFMNLKALSGQVEFIPLKESVMLNYLNETFPQNITEVDEESAKEIKKYVLGTIDIYIKKTLLGDAAKISNFIEKVNAPDLKDYIIIHQEHQLLNSIGKAKNAKDIRKI